MKPKATIIYLAKNSPRDIANLRTSLAYLYNNFNKRFNYPIIIFHENLNDRQKEQIVDATKSKIKFEKIKFNIPKFLNKKEIPRTIKSDFGMEYELGYRHMCRFF